MTEVVAALIWDNEKFMICQRPAHKTRGLLWEFVGGKVESGETKEQALVREIKEELGVEIAGGELLHTIEYDYPNFHLSMDCFWSEIKAGTLDAKEAQEMRWLSANELNDVPWLPADLEIIPKIRSSMNS